MPTTVTPALSAPPVAPPPAPPVVRLRLLGEAAIDVDGVPVGPDSQVLFALLLVLALERGRRLARTALHRLLWPAADDESGRHNLRQVLYKLRQLGVPLDATQSSVMLPAATVTGELVALTSSDHTIGARLAGGRRLGEFLPGYTPGFSAPFAEWLDEQRGLVQAQLRRALLASLAEARALGQWRDVEAIAREVLRFDPLNEEATLALAEATALVGAKAQALGIIDRYLDELGGRPADLRLPATLLRRRIAERFPTHRYVNAADACFVGRATEMATLLALWHRARERRGGAVLLWGEPGIGKTRLAHELGRVATLHGAQVQRVASRSWDVQRPLGAIVDLVPGLRELPGAAGVDPRCNEYLDRLTKHDPDRPLADLPDPATLHRHVRQAVFDLIDALLSEAPLVLVLEDVQWLDASSWEVVAELLRLARTRRLLLVLTSRAAQPAQMPESEDWEALRRLHLDGIDAAATNELLDAMTREAGKYIDPDYREWCVPLANGNPLHAQEIALQWLEKGSVREAPGSLRALLEARIAAMQPFALQVLRVTTLLSEHASPSMIEAVLDASPVALLNAIQHLEMAGLLALRHGNLTVRHELVTEGAQRSMTDGAAALLHARIAKALLAAAQIRSDPALLWDCYQHASAARLSPVAATALTAFADFLICSGRAEACEDLLRQALTALQTEPEAARIRSKIAVVIAHLGRWEQLSALIQDPGDQLSHDDAEQLLHMYQARWLRDGNIQTLQEEAVALASRVAVPASVRVRAATLALVFAENRADRSCHRTTRAIVGPSLSETGPHDVYGAHYKLVEATQRGQIGEVRHAARRLARLANSVRLPAEKSRLLRHASHGLQLAGELGEAHALLLESADICKHANALHALAMCEASLSSLSFYLHDPNQARRWLTAARHSFGETEDTHQTPILAFFELQVDVSQGDVTSALKHLDVIGAPDERDPYRSRVIAQQASRLRLCDTTQAIDETLDRAIDSCVEHLRGRPANDSCDFVASAVAHAMLVANHIADAHRFAAEYLGSMRLRRGPLHVDLANLLQHRLNPLQPR